MTPDGLKPKPGAPIPLFERLVDWEPMTVGEPVSLRVYDRDQQMQSILRNVERLLCSRAGQSIETWRSRPKTVLDYGVPDLSHLFPRKLADMELAAKILKEAIDAFEPRLRQVRLTADPVRSGERRFGFLLEGEMLLGNVIEPVSFPLILENEL